jgi:hypothetical protein
MLYQMLQDGRYAARLLAAPLRQAGASIDRAVPVAGITTLDDIVGESIEPPRMALGATSRDVFRLALSDDLRLTAIGMAIGSAGSLAAGDAHGSDGGAACGVR